MRAARQRLDSSLAGRSYDCFDARTTLHECSPRLMLTTVHIPDRGGMCVQQGNSSAVH